MTQTHATEIQKTLPTVAVLWNKESPSQRLGHLGTSAHLQAKQEENIQAPPSTLGGWGLLNLQLPICSGSLSG